MFEHYIAGTKPSWKRRALITASVAIHAVVAAVLLVWSVLHVEEIAPPAVSLTFFSAAPPPPPPPPPAGRKAVEHKPRPTPKVLQQPTEVPKVIQPPEPKEEEEGEEDGVEGGVEGGVSGGVVGGVVGGVMPEKPPPPPPAPKLVPSFVLDGQRVASPDPHLPEAFIQQHARGEQIRGTYRICISPDGRISDVTVVTPIPGADSSVIEQLKASWRYKPQPIPVCNIRNFIFKLR